MRFSIGPDPKRKLTNEGEQDKPLNVESDVEDEDRVVKPDEQTIEEENNDENRDTLESDFPEDKQDDIEK